MNQHGKISPEKIIKEHIVKNSEIVRVAAAAATLLQGCEYHG
ncbi:MAG: hypothetical protein OEV23_09370 [Gallionella sp.]|nr:hypothetical protein [Gallionella sp.]